MSSNRSRIVVTEIPYMVNKAKLVEKIAELVHEKRVDGISDMRDESDRKGMRIVIELKARRHTPTWCSTTSTSTRSMQETFGANMLALVDGEPKVLSLQQMHLPLHRPPEGRRHPPHADTTWTRPRRAAHILEGLLIALDHIDEIVAHHARRAQRQHERARTA